jgi:hypothetical protein
LLGSLGFLGFVHDRDFTWKRQGQYHKSREVVQDRLEDRPEPGNKGYDADVVVVDVGSDFTNLIGARTPLISAGNVSAVEGIDNGKSLLQYIKAETILHYYESRYTSATLPDTLHTFILSPRFPQPPLSTINMIMGNSAHHASQIPHIQPGCWTPGEYIEIPDTDRFDTRRNH